MNFSHSYISPSFLCHFCLSSMQWHLQLSLGFQTPQQEQHLGDQQRCKTSTSDLALSPLEHHTAADFFYMVGNPGGRRLDCFSQKKHVEPAWPPMMKGGWLGKPLYMKVWMGRSSLNGGVSIATLDYWDFWPRRISFGCSLEPWNIWNHAALSHELLIHMDSSRKDSMHIIM